MARILLVEDEPDVRKMLSDALRLRKHTVVSVAGGPQALAIIENDSFDVVVLDYVLPGMPGLDVLQKLREKAPFLRAIVISGQIDHDVLDAAELERQLSEHVAADRYLAKPVSSESLDEAVADVLRHVSAGDWRKIASEAISVQKVKKIGVAQVDRAMKRAKKKK